MPVVVTQIVVAFVFMERHWSTVTQRLSRAVVSDISMLVDLRMREQGGDGELLTNGGRCVFHVGRFLPGESLPPSAKRRLSRCASIAIARTEPASRTAFWVDTQTYDNYVDIRVPLPGEVMRVLAQRKRVYATNTHIFMIWMVGISVILLMVSGFSAQSNSPDPTPCRSRRRIRQRAGYTELPPAGATEVRSAAVYLSKCDRIERQIEQRTTMLAG